ncbi:MAG: zinc-ribbon domain-containing protein, partial [Clostridia bacterium]|nr:zinc-ribbon domain-containing protein [Clostridia bacterium]
MFFFIGGVQTAQKQIGTTEQIQCPSCCMKTQFEISKTYSYFHLFFIPVFRWNVRYLAKAS